MKVRIDITKGPDRGRNFELGANEKSIIGRGEHVQVRMIDELVSREHCEIAFDGKNLTVCDLGSTNRTFVQQATDPPRPLIPHEPCAIADQGCFYVGPESRFAVVFEPEGPPTAPAAPSAPATTPSVPGNSNFSPSLVPPGNRPFSLDSDSSLFNLTGPVGAAPGLENFGQPKKPIPLKEEPEHQAPPSTTSSSGYAAGSIVPPGEQNVDDGVERRQVMDEESAGESHLKSPPSVLERGPESNQPPTSPGEPLPNNKSPLSSLMPPPESESPTAGERKTARPKADTTPAASPPSDPVKKEFGASHNPLESIANPGQVYTEDFATVPPPEPSPLPESIREPVALDTAQPTEGSPANVQPNGLYFHTGSNPDLISRIVNEIGATLTPVFCVDLTRIDQREPASAPPTQHPEPSDRGTIEAAPNDSPFEDVETAPAAPPQIKGVPLFDFLPEDAQQHGPMLITKDQFDLSLEDAWHKDGIIVFFGKDVDQMLKHLKNLKNTNIQSGKPSRSLFGFCWPMVLHATFESQSKQAVGRIFGDCISCVLLEDPDERHEWNLVSQDDLYRDFGWLKES